MPRTKTGGRKRVSSRSRSTGKTQQKGFYHEIGRKGDQVKEKSPASTSVEDDFLMDE